MAQPRKKKRRRRRLPRDITERPDDEAIELLFGKRVKRKLDQITGKSERSEQVVSRSAMKEV